MEYVKFAFKVFVICLLVMIVGGYFYLVYTGELPRPNIMAIGEQIAPSLAAGGSTIGILAIGLCFLLTAIAPLIYAARSGDGFTVVVSIVSLVVCFAIMASSRTVIDMVLAAIVYFTSALISVVMYSASRVAAAIDKR
ncbi:hypothetical protein [Bradyrhizobium liaoningense]|uniref:hypothetical protein n=1 Tax=Bradyrhizobium liaoningense TaxID=43992 RepID=UPI001BA684C8|nr:hypothetical protein [Bradyrhizobium liaoningense]MBR0903346.1 hypothetical protein [Bradyrhizobium liaoningense]